MVQQQIALFWCAINFTFRRRRRKKIGAGLVCRDLMHWTVMKSVALRYVAMCQFNCIVELWIRL